ncbi:MAG: type I 3-dehydroquinate dehydratase [Treponema sp.]|jgi:3-dehydroquinate dehydratase/shikimate dehydrogenase|nr:type I 3-dehydroquinate dehydratase [Treponema sp.]
MAKICLCLTGKTIDQNLETLNKYRNFIDIVELRVDYLEPDERLYIRRFPELARLPIIMTIRRDVDGGYFSGGEGARVKLFARGLAYASEDSRKNFAYVDLEDDFDVPSLEEAARTFGTRIIRSCHKMEGTIDNIPEKIKSMRRSSDEIPKLAITANSTADVLKMFLASKEIKGFDKILICMGHLGIYSRILAERFGSFLCYSFALPDDTLPGSYTQIDAKELANLYRFRKVTKKTKIYGIVGNPLTASLSPWLFNTVFGLENSDAVYVPFPADSINDFMEIAKELDIQGLSVTAPYKETVLPKLLKSSAEVQSIGACNTMHRTSKENKTFTGNGAAIENWFGDNTDYFGFSHSLLEFLERKNLKFQKVTIIGAGGVARAAAFAIHRLGGKALILNRTVHKARAIALRYNFRWGGLDSNGTAMMTKYSNIIIQTSSGKMDEQDNPLEQYIFTGKETVMDLLYIPPITPFLKRAAAAGCRTINGYDMVIRQACRQYSCFFGREIPKQILSRIITMGDNTWNRIQPGQ